MNTVRFLWVSLIMLVLVGGARADDDRLFMLVFHSEICPHCKAQEPFLQSLDEEHADLVVQGYEIRQVPANRELFLQVAAAHGMSADSVPTVFVGGRGWVGDSGPIRRQIAAYVEQCLELGNCPDSRLSELQFDPAEPLSEPVTLDLPMLGTIDLGVQPLALSTALIAFVDGFNPCSLWVLTMLLALVIHSGSRRRILVVGLTFLAVTTAIYGMFIVGVFGALQLMAMSGWLTPVIVLFALVFAVVNIKDYFWFQRGLSFTIDEKHKPGIYRRIRGLISTGRSTPMLIGATALMAGGIALIELPCTAGFPVIWSGLVTSHEVDRVSFAFLLGLYLLVYLSIELVIFFIALSTLRVERFEERQGRILKLIGGVIMLALAGVLAFAPDLMHDIGGALSVFAGALVLTLLILLLHRRVLPKMGVRIGDEW